MRTPDRAMHFREQAAQAERKALVPTMTPETRRAWLIVSREWTKMANREELKYLNVPAAKLIPEGGGSQLEKAIKELATESVGS